MVGQNNFGNKIPNTVKNSIVGVRRPLCTFNIVSDSSYINFWRTHWGNNSLGFDNIRSEPVDGLKILRGEGDEL